MGRLIGSDGFDSENGRVTVIAELRPDTRAQSLSQPEPTDLLTALLGPCRLRSRDVRQWRLTAPWGVRTEQAPPGFILVLEGTCRLELPEAGLEMTLERHDLAITMRPGERRLLDRAAGDTVPLTDLSSFEDCAEALGVTSKGNGAVTRLLCGMLSCEDDYTRQMLLLLPSAVILNGSADESAGWFAPLVEALLTETEQTLPGGDLLRNHLFQVLLIRALRQTVDRLPNSAGGLVAALRVPGLGATMGAMHSRPEHGWSVEELAELAGLSRAAYAARFLETVGEPPFQYLRNIRMHTACRLLRETEMGIKEIAARVGYATEASFSKAFARWWRDAPGEYRRQSRAAANAE